MSAAAKPNEGSPIIETPTKTTPEGPTFTSSSAGAAAGSSSPPGYGSTMPMPQEVPLSARAYGFDGPPTYHQATDPHAPPPSYDSLYGQLRSVRSPQGFLGFLVKFFKLIWGTIAAAVTIALFSIIPIAMIVIGSMNVYKCPAQRYIPIYLVVGGCFGLFQSILHFLARAKARRTAAHDAETGDADAAAQVPPNPLDGVIGCFLLAWFVAGSVWVYQSYKPSFQTGSEDYCDPVCYWFSFALITVSYVSLLLVLFFLCCCGCCVFCCAICGAADESSGNTAQHTGGAPLAERSDNGRSADLSASK